MKRNLFHYILDNRQSCKQFDISQWGIADWNCGIEGYLGESLHLIIFMSDLGEKWEWPENGKGKRNYQWIWSAQFNLSSHYILEFERICNKFEISKGETA
jgi:hypothetical protein